MKAILKKHASAELDPSEISYSEEVRLIRCIIMHIEDCIWGRLSYYMPMMTLLHLKIMEEIVLGLDKILLKVFDPEINKEPLKTTTKYFLHVLCPTIYPQIKDNPEFWMTFIEKNNRETRDEEEMRLASPEAFEGPIVYSRHYINVDEDIMEMHRNRLDASLADIDKKVNSIDYLDDE